MFHEVKAEIIALIRNLVFARNLSLTVMIAIASLGGLAKLESQNTQLHVAHSLPIRVNEAIINRYQFGR